MTEDPTRHLGDVASFLRGITFKPDDVVPVGSPDSVACMRTKNIQSELELSDVWGIPESFVKRTDQYLLTGDLLVSSANSWSLVGKCCRVPQLQWPATFGGFISVLRGDPSQIEARYLYHWFSSPRIQATVRSYGRQTTNISNLNVDRCLRLWLPLPPLAEQRRIAGILDAADALRAKRREALGQLDTLLRSSFLDMFGDPVTNPMGWEQRHLPELVSKRKSALKRGPFGGSLKKEIFVTEGFKVYEQKNVIYDDFDIGTYFIKESDYERLSPFEVNSNDLLISCSGTIGRIAAVPLHAAPGVMNQALLKIDLDESTMLNSFFLSLWRSQSFEQQVLGMTHGTGMKNMKSMAELKGISFVAPPLKLQDRFAAIVESVEQQKASQRAHFAELDNLFASLQARAFRGDL